jgi:GNAT superfamily N-acetyltransferase
MAAEIKATEVTSETVGHAVSLLERFFREEGFGTPSALIEDNLAAMLDEGTCWAGLAAVGGAFVGVVTVTTMLYVEWGRMGEIGDLYVLPVHRGRGVGRCQTLLWSGAAHADALQLRLSSRQMVNIVTTSRNSTPGSSSAAPGALLCRGGSSERQVAGSACL